MSMFTHSIHVIHSTLLFFPGTVLIGKSAIEKVDKGVPALRKFTF